MSLASCGYMLGPVLKALRSRAIPFHNPYRRNRGDWNPIRHAGMLTRLRNFVRFTAGHDSEPDFGYAPFWQSWLDLTVRCFVRGRKAEFFRIPEDKYLTAEEVADYLQPGVLEGARRGRLDWLKERLAAQYKGAIDYPLALVARYGAEVPEPKITIGTIHSVKGGQSDNVFLLPDVPWAEAQAVAAGGSAQDARLRRFYVGITRARENLILCGPSSKLRVEW